MIQTQTRPGLSGNQLKLIALAAMTCDHIAVAFFPRLTILRIIGRLAFPIFAYMIAEGCQFTKNRKKYLLSMAALALVCQVVYFVAMRSLYQCVLVTFTCRYYWGLWPLTFYAKFFPICFPVRIITLTTVFGAL